MPPPMMRTRTRRSILQALLHCLLDPSCRRNAHLQRYAQKLPVSLCLQHSSSTPFLPPAARSQLVRLLLGNSQTVRPLFSVLPNVSGTSLTVAFLVSHCSNTGLPGLHSRKLWVRWNFVSPPLPLFTLPGLCSVHSPPLSSLQLPARQELLQASLPMASARLELQPSAVTQG